MPGFLEQLFTKPNGAGGLPGNLFGHGNCIFERVVTDLGDNSQRRRFGTFENATCERKFLGDVQADQITQGLRKAAVLG